IHRIAKAVPYNLISCLDTLLGHSLVRTGSNHLIILGILFFLNYKFSRASHRLEVAVKVAGSIYITSTILQRRTFISLILQQNI
ncbi:hypothetical protein ACJX0J_016317, partial [Zea mays]